ncbi:helix-turn-helix domain-containing protein [Paraferrimonas haliotis]|uniref:Transcriptional regulator n=1 Tax=Paraferrimonas haliotis TaxID=2013866 RepID=A0AA37TUU8_9GAMM|nr:XRE family transcriptional regulator [Paraferrimonas haliotis]GLS83259.1 transcriptional regulator [Paraferrimonas haliotis]
MRAGVNEFCGERLTQVRESLAITKVALATIVGVSPATITNWESGKQSPEAAKLETLSSAVNVPTHWFLRPIEKYGDTPSFFRTLASTSKAAQGVSKVKLEWMFEISDLLQHWLDWTQVNLPIVTTPYHLLEDEDIEELAMATRMAMGLGEGPVSNVVLSMENNGIICSRGDIGYAKMDGVSRWNSRDNRPYVFLANDKANGIRSRFDAAHELGHVVMHRFVEQLDKKNIAEIERQANYFASAFLLPATSFARELSHPNLESLVALKPRWKVSVSAMVMRCHQLDIIDERVKTNLFKRISAKGWRTLEPYDNKIPIERPRLLNRAIQMLVDSGGISKQDLLDKLGFSANTLEALCGLEENYFENNLNDPGNLIQFRGAISGGSSKKAAAKVLPFEKSKA